MYTCMTCIKCTSKIGEIYAQIHDAEKKKKKKCSLIPEVSWPGYFTNYGAIQSLQSLHVHPMIIMQHAWIFWMFMILHTVQ